MHPGKVRNDAKFCHFPKQKCLETMSEDSNLSGDWYL